MKFCQFRVLANLNVDDKSPNGNSFLPVLNPQHEEFKTSRGLPASRLPIRQLELPETTVMNLKHLGVAAALYAACNANPSPQSTLIPMPELPQAPRAAGIVDRLEVMSTADAFGGATPAGASGPYTIIGGVVHGRLLPSHADNAGIVDLVNVPKDADGYVDYTTDVVILRPKTASTARRVLFYDAVNRGSKPAVSNFIGADPMNAAGPDANFPSLLRAGYTIVWSGWQGSVEQSNNGAMRTVGTAFPVATNGDGTPITGLSREEYVPDANGGVNAFHLGYEPASLTDRSEVVFTARQSWKGADGKPTYAAPSVPVTHWSYDSNGHGNVVVRFTPPASVPMADGTSVAADGGTIYSFVYRAKNPVVAGIGFAAVRDLVSFLKNDSVDAQGHPNPLADMKAAACAAGTGCAAAPATNFDVAIAAGVSQSGRFLRDFLYQGFNKDGHGAKVFDGLMPVIAGARRTWTNARFAQSGRFSREHEDHWMPGDQFPFAYGVSTDPVSGATDGLMKRCLESATCPNIMQIDGSFEWWGGRASLVVTDGAGHDVPLPDNVRYYLVSGTQHGGGYGVTTGVVTQPAAGSGCQLAGSPVSETPVERALIPALEAWIVKGTPPPPSQYPTVTAGTLVAPSQTGMPDLSDLSVPNGAAATPVAVSVTAHALVNPLALTDYADAVPLVDVARRYEIRVPKVDANGNEIAGIRLPELAVPVATYTGWNPRALGHAKGESCSTAGAAIPFAVSPATRSAKDTRATLAQLYHGRADYQARFGAAADALVARGYLTALDASDLYKKGAAAISPALIPAP